MKNEEKPAKIQLGWTKIGKISEIYISYLGYWHGDIFSSSRSAYAMGFWDRIYLAGFIIKPGRVENYQEFCDNYAKTAAREMKWAGYGNYKLINGDPETGLIFDKDMGVLCYFSNRGVKMDPIPEEGIEIFKKTLEDCLKSD